MEEHKNYPRVGFGVMIVRDGQVLLGKRHEDLVKASSKLHGEGTWTMPGGKLDFGETLEDGAYRETVEETGVKIDKNRLKIVSITNNIVTDAHFVTIGFLAQNFRGEPRVMEPDEIVEWQWFDLNKLPIPMYPASYQILKNYQDQALYQSNA